MIIKEHDTVKMKDGRIGCIVDVTDPLHPVIDFGESPDDFYTDYDISIDQIAAVLN